MALPFWDGRLSVFLKQERSKIHVRPRKEQVKVIPVKKDRGVMHNVAVLREASP